MRVGKGSVLEMLEEPIDSRKDVSMCAIGRVGRVEVTSESHVRTRVDRRSHWTSSGLYGAYHRHM